jgi:tRNA threonylcarbamoyladenosine biosynthesis protein TsaB
MILAVDTSSALTSVCVIEADGTVVAGRRHLDARRHAEVLAPLLAEVIDRIDTSRITTIACGVGPGPYTGLRVGIATALALGVAWQTPVHGVCSLDAVAAAAIASGDRDGVSVALDARRREVYWARYAADGSRIEGPRVGPAAEIDAALRQGCWTGHGAALHAEFFADVIGGDDAESALSYPQATWIARRAAALLDAGVVESDIVLPLDAHGADSGATAGALHGASLLPPRPLYLRRPDAVESTA